MNRLVLMLTLVLCVAAAFAQDVRITGVNQPLTLKDLVGTDTLVTVLLKESGAKDANLKVVGFKDGTVEVRTPKNELVPYLVDSIEEIQVQDGKIAGGRFNPDEVQILRAEQQRVVERARSRAKEIFAEASDDQEQKIKAAVLIALNGDNDASTYLKQLAESNDISTQLEASQALYLVGDTVSETLLRQGLESGNRIARADAASLSGLMKYEMIKPLLKPMFQDRAVELSAPATRALGRLGDREIIPRLLTMIEELNETKGAAAVFALGRLGGEDIREQMKVMLGQTEGKIRLRVVEVLYRLGDPSGIAEIKKIFKEYPTLAPKAALVLAKEGDWEAVQFLRSRLARREDPTEANLIYRADNAAALLSGGDPSVMAVFQEILRSDNTKAKLHVFDVFITLGSTRLIPILQPSIENVDKAIALGACRASVAMAMPQFRERLLEVREEKQ